MEHCHVTPMLGFLKTDHYSFRGTVNDMALTQDPLILSKF